MDSLKGLLEHQSWLESALPRLSERSRLFFAAWCCDPLWQAFSDSFLSAVGPQRAAILRDAYEAVWAGLLTGGPLAMDQVKEAFALLGPIAYEAGNFEIGVDAEEGFLLDCLYYLLDAILTTAPASAAEAGMKPLEWIDFDPPTRDAVANEIWRQVQMVEYLEGEACIHEQDRLKFRESDTIRHADS